MRRNARYKRIPCWYDPVTDLLAGKNWFYDILVEIGIWYDVNIRQVEEFDIWVEVNDLEK